MTTNVSEAVALESAAAEVLGRACHAALGAGLIIVHEKAPQIRQFDADFIEARDLRRAAEAAAKRPPYVVDEPETGGWGVPR